MLPDFLHKYIIMIPLEYRDPMLIIATILGLCFFAKWIILVARWFIGSTLGFIQGLFGIDLESLVRPKGFCYCNQCDYAKEIPADILPKDLPYKYGCSRRGGLPVGPRDFCSQGLRSRQYRR